MTVQQLDPLLGRFSEFLVAEMGLHFPTTRAADLRRGIRLAARDFGFEEVGDCMEWLMSASLTRSQVEILASNLTIGETYFFRDQKTFEVLEQHILPELARVRRGGDQRLRLWSAACCSGEEPYSIAMSLRKVLPNMADWQVTILGTDINPRFLKKAAKGVFSEWSFRSAPTWLKDRHFKRADSRHWQIRPEINRMVSFSHLNLAEDVYPSPVNNTNAMDIIFCRNVLIYFAPEQAKKVIQNLYRCLTEGGWLVLGPTASVHVQFPQFVPVNIDGVTLYKKDSTRVKPMDRRVRWLDEMQPVLLQPLPEPAPEQVGAPQQVLEPQILQQARTAEKPASGHEPALVLYQQGRYAEAVAALETLLRCQPLQPKAMVLLARILANQGQFAEALCWCDHLIGADKLDPTAHYLRATVLHEVGDLNDAVHSFQRALYLDPDFVLAHFALGNLARNHRNLQEAAKHFGNALALTRQLPQNEILPESEGITAGRLAEIISSLIEAEKPARLAVIR